MNNDLVKTFTPTFDNGEPDYRFTEDMKSIFSRVRREVYDGLDELDRKTTALEQEYGSIAYELCLLFLERISDIDYAERFATTNQYRWRSKKLKKVLVEGLKEKGFKPSNITKMIGAAEYIRRLEEDEIVPNRSGDGAHRNRKVVKELAFAKKLGIGSRYLLSLMTEEGVKTAMQYEDQTKAWNTKTNKFESKLLTVRALEEIKRQYPKNPNKTRKRFNDAPPVDVEILENDPSPLVVSDELIGNHIDDAFKFVEYLDRIDLEYLVVGVKDQLAERTEKLEALLGIIKCFSNKRKNTTTTH